MHLRNVRLSMVFFLQFLVQPVCAIDLNCPVVGFGDGVSTAVQTVTQGLPAAGGSFLKDASGEFLKSCAKLLPYAIVAGAGLYATKRGLEFCSDACKNALDYVKSAFSMPWNTKETNQVVTNLSDSFEDWKSSDFVNKLTGLEVRVVNTIKAYVLDLFSQHGGKVEASLNEMTEDVQNLIEQQKEMIAQQKQIGDNLDDVGDAVEMNSAFLLQQRKENRKEFQKIYEGLIDIKLAVEGFPHYIGQSEQAQTMVLEKVDGLQQTAEAIHTNVSNVSGQQRLVSVVGGRKSGSSSLHGSGIYTDFIRPEFAKMSERYDKLEEKFEQSQLDKTFDEQQLLEKVAHVIETLIDPLQKSLMYEKQELQKELLQSKALCSVLMVALQNHVNPTQEGTQNFSYVKRSRQQDSHVPFYLTLSSGTNYPETYD